MTTNKFIGSIFGFISIRLFLEYQKKYKEKYKEK